MSVADEALHALRTWHRMPAADLLARLQVSRATLMRAVAALGPAVVQRGLARKSAYAASRGLRGQTAQLPLYAISTHGVATEVARLQPIHPAGCALDGAPALGWPLDGDMRSGWFDGLPYMLDDMRPQGFLGRHFAQQHAALMQVADDPGLWSEDDVLHVLSLLGTDQSGHYILGDTALRLWQQQLLQPPAGVADADVATQYPVLADRAVALGAAGSSAAGEFPKFTALRLQGGQPVAVIVKFSGSDDTPGSRRWADLLVCEHLALDAVAQHLQVASAASRIHLAAGRCFLEVDRFDRHGLHGRSALCSWAALNAGLFGQAGKPWTSAATALRGAGLIDAATQDAMARLWHFGQLIGNTDMHDGNLSFCPGLQLAPAYDMLPMLFAPQRGLEVPVRQLSAPLPLPAELPAWLPAAAAALRFWDRASGDGRISAAFRQTAAHNAQLVDGLQRLAGGG